MKFKIFSLTLALAAVAGLSSCNDDWQPAGSSQFPAGTGGISSGTLNVQVADEPTKAQSRADGANTVDTSSFIVYITAKGSQDVEVYDKETCRWTYSTMPEIITLPVGEYTVHVASHEPEPVAWGAPYFEGSKDFTVENNKVVNIGSVKCLFQSLKVGVKFDDDFLKMLDPDNSTVTLIGGVAGTSIVWTPSETRCAYFRLEEDNPTVVANFNGMVNGTNYKATLPVQDAKIGDYYIFTFSVNQGDPSRPHEPSYATIPEGGISIDVETIRVDLNNQLKPGEDKGDDSEKHPNAEEWPEDPQQPVDPDDPTPPGPSTDSGVELAPIAGFNPDGVNNIDSNVDYTFIFTTQSPIADVEVDIDSPDYLTKYNPDAPDSNMLTDVGLTSHFSLVNPGSLEEALSGMGFPVVNDVKGKTELKFALSDLITLLNTDPESHVHKFTITVKTEGRPDYVQTLQFRNQK